MAINTPETFNGFQILTDSIKVIKDKGHVITITYYYAIPYKCGSGQHYPGDSGCFLTGDDAAGYVYITSEITTCEDLPEPLPPSGGGGTTPTPPGNYDPCDSGTSPVAIQAYNGATGAKLMVAATTPCDEEPLPLTPTKDIRNKTTDPCISKTVNEALTANKSVEGIMADIIKKFDASKSVTINIFDGATSNGTPGQYLGAGFIGNVFQANITLQTSYFVNSSKESVITTLIHEFVHAYIHTSGSKILEVDHDVISQQYITPMAVYLQNYFNIPLKDAYALAWSGVSDSKAWDLAALSFEFTMIDGNKITKQETLNLSGPYKDNGNQPQYKKGIGICN
ncbi:hypothetical protein GHT06_007010 [Daphnia sinensis]|uniref:Uncharacterized protein n=1 Tax=Daphnia sinensis TaxID=1820382 RepID=A0AAD5KDB6_9CRUS|nr:hypothetical protein GHT06_007010 [Daphnia sinensis]